MNFNIIPPSPDIQDLKNRLDTIKSYYGQFSPSTAKKGHALLDFSDEMLIWLLGIMSGIPVQAPPYSQEWDAFISIFNEQNCTGFLYYRVFHSPSKAQPPKAVLSTLRGMYHRSCVQQPVYERQIVSIAHEFTRQKIRYLFIKGPAFGYQIYPRPALRPFRDIDIYVHPDDIKTTSKILKALSYRLTFDGYTLSPDLYHHQILLPPPNSGYKPIELHWRPLYNPIQQSIISFETLYQESCQIQGLTHKIRTLSLADSFLYACLHMSVQHAGELRLIWIVDIILMCEELSKQDLWQEVEKRIPLWKAGAPVKRAIEISTLWFGTKALKNIPEWDEWNNEGKEILITAERISSGIEHKIRSQIRKMPTIPGKCQAIIHYLAATHAVCMTGNTATVREYAWRWYSIVKITIRKWK